VRRGDGDLLGRERVLATGRDAVTATRLQGIVRFRLASSGTPHSSRVLTAARDRKHQPQKTLHTSRKKKVEKKKGGKKRSSTRGTTPPDVAVDSTGFGIVVDFSNNRIQKFAPPT
jgi:hypothetical protein